MIALSAPATLRNREPILKVLKRCIPDGAKVLEVASGTGEHAAYFAEAMPTTRWTPSDPDPRARESIAAWKDMAAVTNMDRPIALDAADPATWPVGNAGAVVCINMIHIAPWAATEGLMALAESLLDFGGVLVLYGPFFEAETPAAPSNTAFDEDLRRRDPSWGIRDLDQVAALAKQNGMFLSERVAMPANNLLVIFERT